ncbi:iron complex transport system substrate-binding protein [Leucobacter exalbidus]|uniref:Iron complex transport system substrate-binding protein n=1 Tax=Leucobacter exalbidus TaxID=662960 RepID=A0A940T2Q4_9MICO|nr:iron complex transport system substrate-binding protein [Leucobacter exalbidus]
MRTINVYKVVLGVAGLFLLAGCSTAGASAAGDAAPASTEGSTQYPFTTTSCDMEVVVESAPQRIVTLEQTATETLFALGLADRMVGTAYLTDPILEEFEQEYASIPVLADLYPAQEVVLEARPDFIYTFGPGSLSADSGGTRESYQSLGVPTYLQAHACGVEGEAVSFDGYHDEVLELGKIFDVQEASETFVAGQRTRVEEAVAEPIPHAEDISFAWWYAVTDTPYLGTEISDAGNVADLLGVTNAFDDGGPGAGHRHRGRYSPTATPMCSCSQISAAAERAIRQLQRSSF